jgi:DNA uptake protein ComE-like DNA-binding protein
MDALLQERRGSENLLLRIESTQGTLAVQSALAENERVMNRRQFVTGVCTALAAAVCGGIWAQTETAASSPEERVDLNHASLDELMKVPGMTRVWAARIVRFRPYRAKNELLDRGVVTGEVYTRIRDYVIAHRDKQ